MECERVLVVHRLTIRNCDIGLVSGDCIQFDPGRGPWDHVLVEHCTLWTAPLPMDAADFKKGERPGEHAIETKQQVANPRSQLSIRNYLMFGWMWPCERKIASPISKSAGLVVRVG